MFRFIVVVPFLVVSQTVSAVEPRGAFSDRVSRHGEGLDKNPSAVDRVFGNLDQFFFSFNSRGGTVSVYVPTSGSGGNLFRDIATNTGQHPRSIMSGKAALEALKDETKKSGCVRMFTFAGHGWASPKPEGNGLPGKGSGTGLYLNQAVKKISGNASSGATLDDLQKLVTAKSVVFCAPCRVQIHSCNISVPFGKRFAEISGCQVFLPLGKASPAEDNNMVWRSGPGLEPADRAPENEYVRITPFSSGASGETHQTAQPIGHSYSAMGKDVKAETTP